MTRSTTSKVIPRSEETVEHPSGGSKKCWIPPASPVSKSSVLSDIEGKRVKITARIETYKGKP